MGVCGDDPDVLNFYGLLRKAVALSFNIYLIALAALRDRQYFIKHLTVANRLSASMDTSNTIAKKRAQVSAACQLCRIDKAKVSQLCASGIPWTR